MATPTLNTTHAFNLASPYAAELADIERRNRMAQMLQAQSQAPIERFSYNGIEARTSPLSGLAKALQGYTGMMMEKRGLEEQKALGERYKSDQASDLAMLVKGMQGQPAVSEIKNQPTVEDFVDNPNLSSNFEQMTSEQQKAFTTPAVAARAAGTIDPEIIGQLKLPEMRSQALALHLANLAPKTPLILKEGDRAVDPRTFAELAVGAPKSPFANVNAKDYTPESMAAFSKTVATGKPDFTVLREAVSADKTASLAQERAISDRAFYQLSANQRSQYDVDAARLGISSAELFFNTGQHAGGVPALPRAIPPGIGLGPASAVQAPPVAPQTVPQAQPAMVPQAGRVVPQAAVSQTGFQPPVGLTPKQRSELNLELTKEQGKNVRLSDRLGEAAAEAKKLLDLNPTSSGIGASVDWIGNLFGGATTGSNVASKLETLSGWMTSNVPRMEGPQSDLDVKNYKIMAAQVGDRTIPISSRKAALETLIQLQEKYKALNAGAVTGNASGKWSDL